MTDQFRDPLTSRPGLAELLQTHARTAQELLGHTTVQILPLEEIEKRSAAHEAAYRAIESWVSQRTLTGEEAKLLERERCARIADYVAGEFEGNIGGCSKDWEVTRALGMRFGRRSAAQEIARSIRSNETPELSLMDIR